MKHFGLIISLISTLFIFGLVSCSSSVPEIRTVTKISEGIYKDDLRINIKKIYAWVNLMPGAKPRFHITGSIELLEYSKYDLENISIKKISVIQNKNRIYQFTPKIEEKLLNNKKAFLFSTIRGLLLTTALDIEKKIEVELIIRDSASEIIYIIPDVKISEVY